MDAKIKFKKKKWTFSLIRLFDASLSLHRKAKFFNFDLIFMYAWEESNKFIHKNFFDSFCRLKKDFFFLAPFSLSLRGRLLPCKIEHIFYVYCSFIIICKNVERF